MKNIVILIIISIGIFSTVYAQDEIDEKAKLLQELNEERDEFQQNLEIKIKKIDEKVVNLDQAIQASRSTSDKLKKVVERVQILEEKQAAIEKKTFGVYKYNYSSAIVNLASMEREIKPLELFNTSRDFFGTLESVSNPMNYSGYSEWFKTFQRYIQKNKSRDVSLNTLHHILTITGDLSRGTPFAGPLAGSLFEGISTFINSLRKRQTKLKEQSIKMFKLTATISQFTHDKNLIETEWTAINKSLEELKALQDDAIQNNIVTLLNIQKGNFDAQFTNETDAIKRFEYVKKMTSLVEEKIRQEKLNNPEKWKETFYKEMIAVQSLKIRFGTLTFRIQENIEKYNLLIDKYKKDEFIGHRVMNLETKLNLLKSSFESTFSPQEYIKSSTNMYVVE